jgi:hypothetical protein
MPALSERDVHFIMANGQVVTRGVGFAILRIGSNFTIDEIVFAEPGDLALLGGGRSKVLTSLLTLREGSSLMPALCLPHRFLRTSFL